MQKFSKTYATYANSFFTDPKFNLCALMYDEYVVIISNLKKKHYNQQIKGQNFRSKNYKLKCTKLQRTITDFRKVRTTQTHKLQIKNSDMTKYNLKLQPKS